MDALDLLIADHDRVRGLFTLFRSAKEEEATEEMASHAARIFADLVHHMKNEGIKYGLQTMCEGGGQANATIIELL